MGPRNRDIDMYDLWCPRCGNRFHSSIDKYNCRDEKVQCRYPRCLSKDSHNIFVCPSLNHGCKHCDIRGHDDSICHPEMRTDAGRQESRDMFEEFRESALQREEEVGQPVLRLHDLQAPFFRQHENALSLDVPAHACQNCPGGERRHRENGAGTRCGSRGEEHGGHGAGGASSKGEARSSREGAEQAQGAEAAPRSSRSSPTAAATTPSCSSAARTSSPTPATPAAGTGAATPATPTAGTGAATPATPTASSSPTAAAGSGPSQEELRRGGGEEVVSQKNY